MDGTSSHAHSLAPEVPGRSFSSNCLARWGPPTLRRRLTAPAELHPLPGRHSWGRPGSEYLLRSRRCSESVVLAPFHRASADADPETSRRAPKPVDPDSLLHTGLTPRPQYAVGAPSESAP